MSNHPITGASVHARTLYPVDPPVLGLTHHDGTTERLTCVAGQWQRQPTSAERLIAARDMARDRIPGALGSAIEDVLGENTTPDATPSGNVVRLARAVLDLPIGGEQ